MKTENYLDSTYLKTASEAELSEEDNQTNVIKIIKEAIKKMASKSYMPLQEWINENPDFKEVDEKQNYVANVLSTIGKNTESENIDKKIIKNLCLSTYIKQ